MDRIGICELTDIAGLAPVQDWEALRQAQDGTPRGDGEVYFNFRTIHDNNFDKIPHGFTGVYFRNDPFQVVPDSLVYLIKEMSVGGFRHTPEKRELHIWIDPSTRFGTELVRGIADAVKDWMDFNLNPA